MNFLRTLSGTKKAALVPAKPGVRAGRLREGVKGLYIVGMGILMPMAGAFGTWVEIAL